MKEAISLMGRSESIFGMTSNIVYQLPLEPSQQEEFENLVMNFILDQEEKVKQLQEYTQKVGARRGIVSEEEEESEDEDEDNTISEDPEEEPLEEPKEEG
ncbi:hypothetical protein Tco_0532629 [Tanacetum coccineum]